MVAPSSALIRELTADGLSPRAAKRIAQLITDQAGSSAAYAPLPKNTVSLLGDSKTNNHGTVTAGLSNKGFFTWAQIFLRNRVSVVGVHGYPGERSDEIYANIATAIADTPGWCFVDAGTNDVAQVGGLDSLGQTISTATIVAWFKLIFAALKAAGIRPIANTIMPRTGLTTAQSKVQFDVNDWLRRYCPANGIVLVDPFTIWADPASGQPISGYTSDGIHPASNGAAVWGQAIATVLDRVIPPSERLPFSGGTAAGGDNSNIGSELLYNPMLAGTDGTGLASGWSLSTSGTVTKSKVTRTDGAGGEWQQIKLGAAASSASLTQTVSVPNGSGVGAPDTLYAGIELQTDDDFNAVTSLYLKVQITAGTGNGTTAYAMTPDDLAQATNPYPATITLVTPGLVVPAGATSVAITLNFAGTGGTIRAARAFIRSQAVA